MDKIDDAIKYVDHTKLNTFYLDYDRFDNQLKDAFISVSDFSKFSTGVSKGIRELVSKKSESMGEKILNKDMKVRIRKFNYDSDESKIQNMKKISQLDADYFNVPLVTRGIVVGITENKIKMTKTKLRCKFCQYTIPIDFNNHNPYDINKCGSETCGATNSYVIEPEKSVIKNAQTLTIEELSIDNYNSPTQIEVLIDGDLVNKFDVGDTVIVNGDLRFNVFDEDTVNQFRRKLTSTSYISSMLGTVGGNNNGMDFDYLIEANYVETLAEKNINYQDLSDEEREAIETLKKSPHLIEILIRSFASRIYGHDIVKEALIYQAIGGTGRSISEIDNRGEINIILYGDPSVGKTELMRFALDIASKKRFMVGGNITVAGLLGGVDTNNKNMIVAGDAALANGGLLGFDEMNEANPDALNVLNEILEKQTATMTKIKKGNWKVALSFLGCTNPITGGKHRKNVNFNKNIGIKFSLLTRIDSIFVFIDTPNPDTDAEIADSILESYEIKEHINDPKIRINKELLAKFLYIMKNTPNAPRLNTEAKKRAKDFYIKLRTINFNDLVSNLGAGPTDVEEAAVSITTRQFQSIIRYATARARLFGKEFADVEDVEAAINIIEYSLKTVGYDVNTGKYDANLLTGRPAASEISKEKQFLNLLTKMANGTDNKVSKDAFIRELGREPKWKEVSRDKILNQLDRYEQAEYITILNGMISIING